MGCLFAMTTYGQQNYVPGTVAIPQQDSLRGFRKLEQSLVGGVGVKVSRFQLEVRGATTTGWMPTAMVSMPVNSLQIIAGVRL
ncbi:hypothetical protein BW716_17075 [[Flexibacter] sp. ATCC 35208]|nr:hypothetical protein BW716_17075 [[Flexibacter] sp. ATCC 35208]